MVSLFRRRRKIHIQIYIYFNERNAHAWKPHCIKIWEHFFTNILRTRDNWNMLYLVKWRPCEWQYHYLIRKWHECRVLVFNATHICVTPTFGCVKHIYNEVTQKKEKKTKKKKKKSESTSRYITIEKKPRGGIFLNKNRDACIFAWRDPKGIARSPPLNDLS